MPDDRWTPSRVEAALRGAMWTLRHIPSRNLLPAGMRAAWPEIVREWDSYGWDRATKPRMQASAEQIAEMDRTLAWVWDWLHPTAARGAGLVEDTGNILLMRGAGLTWERIGDWRLVRWMAPRGARGVIPGGNSVKQLREHHRRGVARIVDLLGGDASPPPVLQREEWGVSVEVARKGETLGEGSYGPVHARARWAMVPRRR